MSVPLVCIAGLQAKDANDAISALASRLAAAGHVKATFERAAIAREKRSPTGLPFEGTAVAIPHAEPEHVEHPAIAVATLATPVRFRQMGTPQILLDVRLVVMPVLTDKEQAAAGLSRIIELLQDGSFREELIACADNAALERAWGER